MSALGDLIVKIGASFESFDASMSQLGPKLKAASKDAEKQFGSFDTIGSKLEGIGTGLTAALTLPILGIGAAAVKSAMDFDEAMDKIRAKTGATGPELDALGVSFKNIFSSVPNSTTDVTTALSDLTSRMGITGTSLETLATQELNLSRITGSELSPLIAATTRAFGDWSIASKDQSSALDYLYKVSQNTGIGVTRLTELVVQFGAPMRALGFNFEEAAALMGKWEKEGVNLETVLSGLRFALGNFAKAGLEPKQALQDIIEKIKGAGSESEATAIAFQTFGKRAAVDMGRAIIEGRFNIDELVNSLKGSSETINKAAADTMSFADRLTLFKNKAETAFEPLGKVLVTALDSLLQKSQPVIEFVQSLAEKFANMDPTLQAVVIGVAAFAAAIGPIVVTLGAFIASIGTIGTTLTTIGTIFGIGATAVAGWAVAIAAAVAALVALGVWVYSNWEPIKAVVLQAWDGLSEVWGAAWNAAVGFITGAWDTFKGTVTTVWNAILGIPGAIWSGLTTLWQAEWDLVVGFVTGLWTAFTTTVTTVWNGISGIVGAVWGGLTTAWTSSWGAAKSWIESAWSDFKTAVGPVWDGIVGAVGAVWDALVGAWGVSWETAKSFIAGAWDTFKSDVTGIWDAITGAVGNVWDGLVALWTESWNNAKQYITGAWDDFKSEVSDAWDAITGLVGDVWDGTKEAFKTSWDAIKNALKSLWDGISTLAESMWGAITGFISKVWDPIKTAFESVWASIKGALSSVWEGIKSMATTVWGAVIQKINDFLGAAAKIPGVNKLLNLDDAWKSAKQLETNTKDATTAVNDHGKAHETNKPKVEAHTGAVKDGAREVENYTQKVKDWNLGSELWKLKINDIEKSFRDQIRAIYDAQKALQDHPAAVAAANEAYDKLNTTFGEFGPKLDDITKIKIPAYIKAANDSIKPNVDLNGALKDLGITSTEKYDQIAKDAGDAYDAVMGSGMATTWEKDNAMLKMLKAQAAAMKANGVDIPADMQKMIDDLETKVKDKSNGMPKVTSHIVQFGKDVSASLSGCFNGIAYDLITGDGSIANRLKGMWKDIAAAVVDNFVAPATKAIGDFISGIITDLLSGKGLGGILQTVKDIGTSIAGVFGSGSGVINNATGAAGSAGGAAGGVGAAVSGGLMGTIGAIASVGTLITGVIGNFQNARQETTLNAIEESTRYVKIWTGEQPQNMLWCLQTMAGDTKWVMAGVDTIGRKLDDWLSPTKMFVEQSAGTLGSILGQIGDVSSNTYWSLAQLQQSQVTLNAIADKIGNTASAPPAGNITVQVTAPVGSSDPNDFGDAIANRLAMRRGW